MGAKKLRRYGFHKISQADAQSKRLLGKVQADDDNDCVKKRVMLY